jgi:hypothetical protein
MEEDRSMAAPLWAAAAAATIIRWAARRTGAQCLAPIGSVCCCCSKCHLYNIVCFEKMKKKKSTTCQKNSIC